MPLTRTASSIPGRCLIELNAPLDNSRANPADLDDRAELPALFEALVRPFVRT